MRHSARTLLACWLVVVATGTVVTHRHAAARGHTHGLGFASLPTSPTAGGLPAGHRHFVLLGVEFGATPCGSDGDAPDTPRICPVADAPAPPGDHLGILPGHGVLMPAAGLPFLPISVPDPARAARLFRNADSCPLTSFARSGVLRV